MSRDQRLADNHALIAAQKHALNHGLPLAVLFVLQKVPAQRAREQYQFMIDGLYEIEQSLKKNNIPFIALVGNPLERLKGAFHHLKPAAVYVDFNPFAGTQYLARELAVQWPIIEVDTHNSVPAWLVSDKQEVGARTLRPKIHRLLSDFFVEPDALVVHPHTWPSRAVMPLKDVCAIFAETLAAIPQNHIKLTWESGELAAQRALRDFIEHRFKGYAINRNNPTIDGLSNLSPYFHFGQLSTLRVLLVAHDALQNDATLQEDYDRLLEEMIVRKELSDNFCYYNPQYATLMGAPEWAQKTLQKHADDPREFIYSKDQFEQAQTHDEAWNAAQRELRKTGKMHGYMRMYWAKKVLEWSSSPQDALETLVYLNDFYSIDGGDPNGYVGILWSIAGLHDRPWGERAVYGTIRSMVYSGLKRKFDVTAYIQRFAK